MYPLIFYVLKCLIFRYLLKIANIGKKRYTKSLQIRKIAVPLLLETGTKPKPKKSSLIILIAKKRALIVTAF